MENSVRSESCEIRHDDLYEVSKRSKKGQNNTKHKTRLDKVAHVAHEALLLGKCSTMRDNPSQTGARRCKWREWMSTVYLDTKMNVVALAAKRSFKWISPVFPRFPWQLRSVVWYCVMTGKGGKRLPWQLCSCESKISPYDANLKHQKISWALPQTPSSQVSWYACSWMKMSPLVPLPGLARSS